jgi:hypothetical protein
MIKCFQFRFNFAIELNLRRYMKAAGAPAAEWGAVTVGGAAVEDLCMTWTLPAGAYTRPLFSST